MLLCSVWYKNVFNVWPVSVLYGSSKRLWFIQIKIWNKGLNKIMFMFIKEVQKVFWMKISAGFMYFCTLIRFFIIYSILLIIFKFKGRGEIRSTRRNERKNSFLQFFMFVIPWRISLLLVLLLFTSWIWNSEIRPVAKIYFIFINFSCIFRFSDIIRFYAFLMTINMLISWFLCWIFMIYRIRWNLILTRVY